ncbi:unnamed protein product, partial [Mesorhabditis spiculigera]
MGCDCFVKAFGYLGLTFVAYKVLTALYNIVYPYFLAGKIDLLQKAGAKWAVVTGSTDGIGKAYSFDLARRGFNVLLISRSQDKLEATKKEIKDKYSNVEIKTYTFDFSTGKYADYVPLLEELKKYDIGVLVNNVGLSYEYPERMHLVEGGVERLSSITSMNTLPPTLLTATVLPQMVERKKGVVINLSSAAGYNTMAYWAVYSATKRYVQWLSAILRMEYGPNITIQTVCPMLVATNMSKVKKTSFFTPNPTTFARAALDTVGHVSETTGYYTHQIQLEFLSAIPCWLRDKILTNTSLSIRGAALRKKEREAKSQ